MQLSGSRKLFWGRTINFIHHRLVHDVTMRARDVHIMYTHTHKLSSLRRKCQYSRDGNVEEAPLLGEENLKKSKACLKSRF